MNLQLHGKVVIITGASRGIGRACALRLAEEGARLSLVARGEADLSALVADIRHLGGQAVAVCDDVSLPGAGARIVAATLAAYQGVDIIIANAGKTFGTGLIESTAADWEATYRLNVGHAVDLLRESVPAMTARGGGSAVFISSISGRLPVSCRAQYAASKAALTHAARSLAQELAAQRIRVNSVSPGSVIFPGGGWETRQRTQAAAFKAFEEDHPRRRLGSPQEIADVIAFIASPCANWINGADIPVDGGQRLPSID